MTDAQHLVDFARRQFNEIADDVERHFELVAGQLRDWIPAGTPFARPPPPPKRLPPPTSLQVLQRWMSRHRALTAATIAFVLTGSVGAYIFVKERRHKRKRRARKSPSGARTDVVVVAGAVANPLASAVYLDLERRGFVVYVVANNLEDDQYIRSQSRLDVLPLHIDPVDPFQAQQQVSRFQNLLGRDHRAFDEAQPHRLRFCGLVLIPDTTTTPSRIGEISTEEWSDALNAKLLHPISTTHLFLPILLEHPSSKVLLLTPSVTPALKPPTHAVQNTVYGGLEAFAASLAAELQPQHIGVTHFKLGDIDIPAVTARQRREAFSAGGWLSTATGRGPATPVRKLQDAVFDVLAANSVPRRTWYVGRGSLTYDVIGNWMPAGLVGWILNAKARFGSSRAGVDEEKKRTEGDEEMGLGLLRGSTSMGSLTWEKVEQEG